MVCMAAKQVSQQEKKKKHIRTGSVIEPDIDIYYRSIARPTSIQLRP
jgi:hypothetical protein